MFGEDPRYRKLMDYATRILARRSIPSKACVKNYADVSSTAPNLKTKF
jgi:hypothetical protein